MGIVAIATRETATGSASVVDTIPSTVPLGGHGGGLLTAVALIFLLAYLDLYIASEDENLLLRRLLEAAILPLLLTFAGIVLFESLTIV